MDRSIKHGTHFGRHQPLFRGEHPPPFVAQRDNAEPIRSERQLPLRLGIGLNVSSSCPQAGMTAQRLNVAQTAADLTDLPGSAGNETSPAGSGPV
jgi:hypothetical protein